MRRCPNCMEFIKKGDKCPSCGHFLIDHNDPAVGKTINGRFLLGCIFKQNIDFNYRIGWDKLSKSKVIVCCFSGERFEGVNTKHGGIFTKKTAIKRFVSYGRNLASCGLCSLLPRTVDVVEEDSMGYIVTNYFEGESLASLLQKRKTFSLSEADKLLKDLIEGLNLLHNYRTIFGSVNPDNIYISKEGSLYLLGVGIPFYDTILETEFIKPVIDVCYAAPEVFDSSAKKGAYTDVYSAAAVYYRIVSGEVPPVSYLRCRGETATSLHYIKGISKPFAVAISNAFCWQVNYRTKSVSDFLEELCNDETHKNRSALILLADFVGIVLKVKNEFKSGFKGLRKGISRIKDRIEEIKISITPEKKKKISKKLAISGVCLVSAAAVVTVAILFINGTFNFSFLNSADYTSASSVDSKVSSVSVNEPEESKTKCPDVTGLTLKEAQALIEKEGLEVGDISEKQVPKARVGLVLDQSVEPGETLEKGKKIKLRVGVKATDNNLKEVPDLIGKEMNEAIKLLNSAGFTDINVKFEESDSQVGSIVKQSYKAGELYNVTETFSILVSGKRVKVYDFCGMSLDEAVYKAKNFSITFVEEQKNKTELDGENYSDYTVTEQSIEPDADAYKGQNIVFTVKYNTPTESAPTQSDSESSQSQNSSALPDENTSSNVTSVGSDSSASSEGSFAGTSSNPEENVPSEDVTSAAASSDNVSSETVS